MSRPDDVSLDPLAARLAGFSPVPVTLDRDAIFFQAGQASARPRHLWPALAALLAATQAATLAVWLGLPLLTPTPPALVKNPTPEPAPQQDVEPAPRPSPGPAERVLVAHGVDLSASKTYANLVAPSAPLSVLSAYREYK